MAFKLNKSLLNATNMNGDTNTTNYRTLF